MRCTERNESVAKWDTLVTRVSLITKVPKSETGTLTFLRSSALFLQMFFCFQSRGAP